MNSETYNALADISREAMAMGEYDRWWPVPNFLRKAGEELWYPMMTTEQEREYAFYQRKRDEYRQQQRANQGGPDQNVQ